MAKRKRRKRPLAISKHCGCPDRQTCGHDWYLRVYAKGHRQRVNLSQLFPGEPVDVAAARAKSLARSGALRDGKLVSASPDLRLTVAETVTQFKAAKPGAHYYLTPFVETLGPKALQDVTGHDVESLADVVQERAKAGKRGGLDARRHLLASLRYLFNWAIKQKMVRGTPFTEHGVAMIAVPASRSRERRLQPGEEAKLLAACDPWAHDYVQAALETGCRGGELRALQWRDVREDVIVLTREKTKTKRTRAVPISPTLRSILERRRKGPDGNDLPEDGYVFGDGTGKKVARRVAHDRWAAARTTANLVDLNFHDLRHEFGSQLLEAGASLHEVQATLGHTSLTMTGRYLNATTTGLREAFDKLAAKRQRGKLKIVGKG